MTRAVLRRSLLGLALAGLAGASARAAPLPADPSDISLGSAKAPIQVVEYASLSCPHCAAFNEEVFPTLKAKYIDTGKVRYTLREFLTQPAEAAAAGFMLARCAGPSKYYSVVDGVFRGQALWSTGVPFRSVLSSVAASNGVSEAELQACLRDPKGREAVIARHEKAVASGVRGTPTIFVNGKPVEIPDLAHVEAAIAAAGKK